MESSFTQLEGLMNVEKQDESVTDLQVAEASHVTFAYEDETLGRLLPETCTG